MEKVEKKKRKNNAELRLFTKEEWLKKFFGKVKTFGDGVKFQRKMRDA